MGKLEKRSATHMNTQTKPNAKVNNSKLTTSSKTTFGLVQKISEEKNCTKFHTNDPTEISS